MKIKTQLLYRFIVRLLIGYRFFDAPIEQVNNSFSVAGIFFRMRYLNDSYTIPFVELYKKFHDFFSLLGIQVPGRLVCQYKFGFCHQRPCYTYELLLTSG